MHQLVHAQTLHVLHDMSQSVRSKKRLRRTTIDTLSLPTSLHQILCEYLGLFRAGRLGLFFPGVLFFSFCSPMSFLARVSFARRNTTSFSLRTPYHERFTQRAGGIRHFCCSDELRELGGFNGLQPAPPEKGRPGVDQHMALCSAVASILGWVRTTLSTRAG